MGTVSGFIVLQDAEVSIRWCLLSQCSFLSFFLLRGEHQLNINSVKTLSFMQRGKHSSFPDFIYIYIYIYIYIS